MRQSAAQAARGQLCGLHAAAVCGDGSHLTNLTSCCIFSHLELIFCELKPPRLLGISLFSLSGFGVGRPRADWGVQRLQLATESDTQMLTQLVKICVQCGEVRRLRELE